MDYEKIERRRKRSSIDSCDGHMYSKNNEYISVDSDVFPDVDHYPQGRISVGKHYSTLNFPF